MPLKNDVSDFSQVDEPTYRLAKLDYYLQWLAKGDSNSSLKDRDMVETDFDIKCLLKQKQAETKMLLRQKHELEQACIQEQQQRRLECDQEISGLQPKACPGHLLQGLRANEATKVQQQWLEAQIKQLQGLLERDLKLIATKYNTPLSQCQEQLAQMQQYYDETIQSLRNMD